MKNLKVALLLFIIIISTAIAFYPSIHNDFTNWDDSYYVTNNHLIRELSWKNIKDIFSSSFVSNYVPLTILSYTVEYHFFGANPYVYHTTNLIFHLFNCILVFWLFFLISKNDYIAFIVSLLFAIHPMHVESVAWISERKDVLYSFFFLSALISYFYYINRNCSARYFIFSMLFFILSLLAKPMAITMPAVLFLIDYMQGRQLGKLVFAEKIVSLMPAVLFGVITICSQDKAIKLDLFYSFLDNAIFICYRVNFYISKIFLPINLSCLYPYPEKINGMLPSTYILSPLILVLLTVLISFLAIKKIYRKTLLFGFLFFFITITPVLQIIPVGQAIVADRYTYIPYLGLFFIIATFTYWFYEKYIKNKVWFKFVFIFIFVLIMASWGLLTWQRCHVWQDSVTLWSDFLKKYPNNVTGYSNRGSGYFLKGDYQNAILDYYKSLEINPHHIPAHYNLCVLYERTMQYKKALIACKNTIELKSDYVEAYNVLGNTHLALGNTKESIALYKNAINLNRTYVPPYINLGAIYYFLKDYDLSFKYFMKAIELGGKVHPDFDDFMKNYPIQKSRTR